MTYHLDLLPRFELKDELTPEGRIYDTPVGRLPSVTTVLSKHFNTSDFIDEWRARIGAEKADKITRDALANGTELHGLMEKDLMNEDYRINTHSCAKMRYSAVRTKLRNVDAVFGVELPLYSGELRTAGRADAVVKWDGRNTILDLKTASKYKKKEHVLNYFVQATTYGIMVKERYNLDIERIVIVFSKSDDFECYCFNEPLGDYMDLAYQIFQGRNVEVKDSELQ